MVRIGRHVRIAGRVQGVFFRAWTAEQATALGVNGWVRNCPDGSVEAHLAGEAGLVEQLIDRIRDGPPHAMVSEIQVENVDPEMAESFSVRH
jgi:acylphosphatase